MITHLVMMKFKPETKDSDIAELEKVLDALPEKIVEIQTYEFGRDMLHSERSFDFAIVALFANMDALKRYDVHPLHVPVKERVRALSEKVVVVDFEAMTRDFARKH